MDRKIIQLNIRNIVINLDGSHVAFPQTGATFSFPCLRDETIAFARDASAIFATSLLIDFPFVTVARTGLNNVLNLSNLYRRGT